MGFALWAQLRCLCTSCTEHSFAVYALRAQSTASLFMHFVHRAQLRCLHTACAKHARCLFMCCAHSTHFVHLWASPTSSLTLFQTLVPRARFTFYLQPQKVNKKGRPPANFDTHILERLRCQSGERQRPCKTLRLVQTSMSGYLTSRSKIWKIGVGRTSKAATLTPRHGHAH